MLEVRTMSASVSPIHRGIVPEEFRNRPYQRATRRRPAMQSGLSCKPAQVASAGEALPRAARDGGFASVYASRLYAAVAT